MTNVYAWPPVGLTGWEFTKHQPVSRSVSLISGRSRTTSAQRARYFVTAKVDALGLDDNGGGYIEELKVMLEGGKHLIRIPCLPMLPPRVLNRYSNGLVTWTEGGSEVTWTEGGLPVGWVSNSRRASPTTIGGYPGVAVTGFPANTLIVRPNERVEIINETTGTRESTRAIAPATTNNSGSVNIRVRDTMLTSGLADIGRAESRVFEVMGELPRAVMPVSGSWTYDFALRQVFEDEYPDGWTEIDRWA